MSDNSSRPAPHEVAQRLAAIVAVIASLAVIWLPPWIAAHDFPPQLVGINVVVHPELYPDHVPNFPLTQYAFNGLCQLLARHFPLIVAVKITLTIGVSAWAAIWAAIAKSWSGSRALAVAAASAQFVGWLYVMGFSNYAFGLILGAMGFWVLTKPREITRADGLLGSTVFVGAVLAHLIAGAHFMFFAGLAALARREGRTLKVVVPSLVPAGVYAAYATWASGTGGGVAGMGTTAIGWQWGEFPSRLNDVFASTFVGYSMLGYLPGVFGVGYCVAQLFQRTSNDEKRVRVLRSILVAGFLLYWLAPDSGLGWAYAAPRLIAPIILAGAAISAADSRAGKFGATAFALSCAVATASAVAPAWLAGTKTAEDIADFGDQPVGRMFGVLYLQPSTLPAPHATVDVGVAAYATLNGGLQPGMYSTSRAMHWSLFRQPLRELIPGVQAWFFGAQWCDELKPQCVEQISRDALQVANSALPYDSVVAVNAPSIFGIALESYGYAKVAPTVWRTQTASLTISIPTRSDAPIAQVSRPGEARPLLSAPFGTKTDDASAAAVTFQRLPAGPLVLRVGTSSGQLLLETPLNLGAGEHKRLELGAARP